MSVGVAIPPAPRAWPYLATTARVGLGSVWVYAGWSKAGDLPASVRSVRAYDLLPETANQAVGAGLPMLEIALGILLIVGLGLRPAAVISSLLLVVFLVGISTAWARGLQIECGCFGSGGQLDADQQPTYGWEMLRDAGLLTASMLLAVWPTSRMSVDALMSKLHRDGAIEEEIEE